jgi:NAD(P)-dependent dehydrogenase (short-subunit alcohol dehydrogenase family)
VGRDAEGPAGPLHSGDEVIAYRIAGAYASHVVIPAASVVPKPPALSFEGASGLMLTGSTAVHALTVARVGRGDTVLIHGAAGGVGLMAVQLATSAGATVIGTASAARHDSLRALGALPVAYGDGVLERIEAAAPGGVDAALDLAGTVEAIDVSLALVNDRTRIVSIVRSQAAVDHGITLLGAGPGADPGTDIRDAARLELVRQVATGYPDDRAHGKAQIGPAQTDRKARLGGELLELGSRARSVDLNDEERPTGAGDPAAFGQSNARIRPVFPGAGGEHVVEGRVGEREALGPGPNG